MPRIAKRYLQTVVFIYPDSDAGNSGERVGGTGFIAARYVGKGFQTFVVTNRHVISAMPNPVIRINSASGGVETYVTNQLRWTNHPDGDDLAGIEVEVHPDQHDIAWVWSNGFIDEDTYSRYLGLGSDIAMLGRYVGISGGSRNIATARFGCLAAADLVSEKNKFGLDQQSFLVELQSVPGFSGSPVIAFLPTNALSEHAVENAGLGPWLLGVDWMHYDDPAIIRDRHGITSAERSYVNTNSGFAGVIPAWRIHRLLDEFNEAPVRSLDLIRY